MIKLINMSKTYKGDNFETKALIDINMEISEGEFIAIMGKSASGKSTMLHILGGMDSLSEGEYYLNHEALHQCNPYQLDKIRKKYISFVFQHFALMDKYTIFENIEMPLIAKNIKRKKRKEIITEKMQMAGIEEIMNKYPNQISGGQQQRTAIVRALVSDNPIILADEPPGALDSENTIILMNLLKSIHKQGKTIIVVTHNHDVAKFADRIIKLQDGKIVI